MPELPEVETIRRQLEPLIVGAELVDAWAFPSAKFLPALDAVGATVRGVGRRGKYLLVALDLDDDDHELVVHLGMTGRLTVRDRTAQGAQQEPIAAEGEPSWGESVQLHEGRHLRASWRLSDGRELHFDDVRRFGRLAVVGAGQHECLPTLAALGPEPFDDEFDPEHLRRAVNSSRQAVKTQLLGQRVVAGVGNIYADEALWRAGVHPRDRRLSTARAVALRDSVRAVLREGIDNGGTTLRNYRDVGGASGENLRNPDCYGRGGEPCVRCGELLRRGVVDARATTWCPACQPRR